MTPEHWVVRTPYMLSSQWAMSSTACVRQQRMLGHHNSSVSVEQSGVAHCWSADTGLLGADEVAPAGKLVLHPGGELSR